MKRLIATALYVAALAYSHLRRRVRELPHECWPNCTHASHFRHIPSVADAFDT